MMVVAAIGGNGGGAARTLIATVTLKSPALGKATTTSCMARRSERR